MYPLEISLPFVTAFGLIVGSYLNVVIYRLPQGLSTVQPASRCPRCVMPIRPFDNVPVLGYLWLRARCRDCGLPIPIRYPLVEAIVGAWFAFAFLRADSWIEKGSTVLLGSFLLVIALIDFDHQRIPIWQTLAMIAVGLTLQPWLSWARWGLEPSDHPSALAFGAAVVGGLSVPFLTAAGRLFGIEDGLASGDALALALIGAFLGPRGALVAFLVGGAAASLIYAPRLLRSRRRMDQPIPFVTYLAFGAVSALVAGPLSSTWT
ncbi:MAG: prepilin peptidase [Acidobacteriota bacterium]